MSTTADLLADLTGRGIELRAEGGRLRFRPVAAMTPELAERVKAHKGELLALLNPSSMAEPSETHADREIRRFLRVAVPRPDGRGWYDPGSLRDAAGMAYLAYVFGDQEAGSEAVDDGQGLR